MHLKSFIGGIHPKDQKHYTKDLPIIKLNASDEVVFLLKQHIGAPCKPLVKIKDEVKVGQKIACEDGFVSSPIISSVSGTVKAIEERINPVKDLDGISPVNLAKVYAGDVNGFAPCTAEAVIEMLDYAGIDLTGKRVTVVGRSLVIGKPVAMMLMKKNATVTVCHTKTKDMAGTCRNAEVLVAAAGSAKMIKPDYVADDAVVIDVGINVDESGNLCGDVDFDSVAEKTSVITPVPGGVGSVTTSVLAKHLLRAAKMRKL